MSSRSWTQRTGVILGLLALSVYLFYIGKGHTLLLDTNEVTIDNKALYAYASATISVDGQELDPMGPAERVMVTVSGPKHKIVIVDDEDADIKVERTFTIPTFMNMAIVSIPAILGDAPAEHWVTVFMPPPPEDRPAEQIEYQKD